MRCSCFSTVILLHGEIIVGIKTLRSDEKMGINTLCYLFDLDGTLTTLDDDTFIKIYFKLLSEYSRDRVDPKRLLATILTAVKNLEVEVETRENNYQRFMRFFSKKMGDKSQQWYESFFNKFYETDFDGLETFIKPRENAVKALLELKKQGHRIVLATNPVFPYIAIEKRIRWVGLTPEIFDHITTMENSHFVKPLPDYYLEIMETVGVSPKECIMIGNDEIMDGACRNVGIAYINIMELKVLLKDL
ncbi:MULTISPECIES: HAD family hydrolase [unclassified Kosmotoga]|uniref:HAD family hydrolase n=1 Tax=unclassified Kosmotoga TaxID=2631489 RepID=UPI001372324E|nr:MULTISPECIES: HAD family hydrolase [unclassified Kosmotoga]